jgi:hypothetical protein
MIAAHDCLVMHAPFRKVSHLCRRVSALAPGLGHLGELAPHCGQSAARMFLAERWWRGRQLFD